MVDANGRSVVGNRAFTVAGGVLTYDDSVEPQPGYLGQAIVRGPLELGSIPSGRGPDDFRQGAIMKILFVSDVSIHHVIGGAERVLYEQAVGLARRGHEVAVLTRRLAEHDTAEELIQNVQEWRYPIDNRNALTFLHATLTGGTGLFERLQKAYAFDVLKLAQMP